ncbi:MAG TPA: penicillin-binding protein 2 [Candidatus Baltobacteraceae bacterium]|nr:penicillin-binding protein 2 [Candidatus Baltobacteraceae bacterium]
MSYWFRNDNRLPQERLAAASYVIVGMITLLLLGFWKLQVIDSDKYGVMAERNRVRSIPIIAPRGRMLDRDGRVLVDNYPSFSVLLLRDDMPAVEKNLPAIADGLGLSLDDLKDQLSNTSALPKFQPIVIKPEATPGDVAFIESHRADIPLLEMLMVHRRRYLPGGFMAHASGYVGEVSEQQIEAGNGKYRPGDVAGKSGLERQYNDLLVGTDGMRRVIVNSVGKEMGRLSQQEAIPGKQIQLTIDYDLQQVAENGLGDKKGAVIALDPRTGEVLAFASHPAPDPNDFAIRVSKEEWQRLNEDQGKPLLNRVTQAQLAPGSVFKIIMATAMLESKTPPQNFTAFCPGYGVFYGQMHKCWVYGKKSHGTVNLHEAIVQSCDVFFYNVGQRMGIDTISKYSKMLGLGARTGIDMPSEEPGLVPSEEWVQRVYHHKWYPGSTISVSIGQGSVMVTPLQVAYVIGGIASAGDFKQPHLLKDAQNIGEKHVELAESTVEQVTQGMYGVINEAGGTGNSVKLQGIEFCGKSGTAQMMSYSAASRLGLGKGKNDGWFVGFAPRRDPEIVVAAVVEDTSEHGGTAAGPVVRDIVKAYYDKKAKKSQGQSTAQNLKPGAEQTSANAHAVAEAPKVALKREVPAKVAQVVQKKQEPE